ncbi:unnamed protein product [Darwinula stevensoni]|uniref:Uncharacterized protein n=1 Tax=Darwinula stevensoni TaxID=69355 RepID=A0A7R8XA78_9CRUS|nr:unnamed protein product [Darwinula stevensoni]CAG0891149.1 unnamed protein product [Darwinula stevensoni]
MLPGEEITSLAMQAVWRKAVFEEGAVLHRPNMFYEGSGKDCRLQVQHLNYQQGERKGSAGSVALLAVDDIQSVHMASTGVDLGNVQQTQSKWATYTDNMYQDGEWHQEHNSQESSNEQESKRQKPEAVKVIPNHGNASSKWGNVWHFLHMKKLLQLTTYTVLLTQKKEPPTLDKDTRIV